MRFLDFANGSLWAMEEGVLNMFVSAIQAKIDGRDIKDYVLYEPKENAAMSLASSEGHRKKGEVVAVIPIDGALTHRSYGMSSSQSYASIQRNIQDALNNENVGSILLDIDSPGGTVAGVHDLGVFLREARSLKPVYSYTDGTLASAAYWIAANTDGIVASPTAKVGSIGVYGMHVDKSKKLENEGIKVTYIKAGKYKTIGNETETLSKENLDYLQGLIDSTYGAFLNEVSTARNLSLKDSDKWAEGKVFPSADGLNAGLIDSVGSFNDAVSMAQNRLTNEVKARSGFVQVGGEIKENIPSITSTTGYDSNWYSSTGNTSGEIVIKEESTSIGDVEDIHEEGHMPFDPKKYADDPNYKAHMDNIREQAKEEALSTAQAKAQQELEAKDSMIETLKSQNQDLDGRVKVLEKQQAIQTERSIKAEADGIFNTKIAATAIPERLHEKVRKQVNHNDFVEDNKLDHKAYAEAVDAELKDWEVETSEAPFQGNGLPGKSAVHEEKGESVDDTLARMKGYIAQSSTETQ